MQTVNQYYRALKRGAAISPDPIYADLAAGLTGFAGQTVADNGSIYYCPFSATVCRKFNPATGVFTSFGSLPGGNKYIGIVKAANGKLYCIPYDSANILVIDPATDTTATFGSFAGTNKYAGGVLASDGFIYSFPFRASTILKIDPATNTAVQFGSLAGSDRYYGSILGEDGHVYGVPYSATQVAKLDISGPSITYFGSLPGSAKYNGGFLAPSGKLYCMCRNAGNILVINPITSTTYTIGSGLLATIGGFLVQNNTGYGVNFSGTSELTLIDLISDSATTLNVSAVAGGGLNGVLAPNGKAYTTPFIASYQLEISNLGPVSPSDFLIPSPLSGLPTSNYNRYINKL
jgi:DNA-binding beta-propeller fold protein YncE